MMRRTWILAALVMLLGLHGCGKDETGNAAGGGDEVPATAAPRRNNADLSIGRAKPGPGTPSDDKGAWSQFRGDNRDGIASDGTPLARAWPAGGPEVLWKLERLGPGFAGPAIRNGRVYFHDYDEKAGEWMIRCLSLADGQEIWRWSYPQRIRPNHEITRTVPAVDDEHVVSLDPKGVLHGFDALTGERLWARDLPFEYDDVQMIPQWYNGQCPLLDGERVILGIGSPKGDVLMAALDKATGEYLWKTPNPLKHSMSHASVMPVQALGRKQYVWCTVGKGLIGVDPDDGSLLWEHPWTTTSTALAASPLDLGDGRVLMTASYKAGTIVLRLESRDGTIHPHTELTLEHPSFESATHTPVLWQGHLYAVNNAHGGQPAPLACLSLDGRILWQHAEGKGFGLGPYMIVNGLLLALEETGTLRLIEPSPEGYRELAAAKVLPGHDAWAPMAYADGKLIVRDVDVMVCLRIGP